MEEIRYISPEKVTLANVIGWIEEAVDDIIFEIEYGGLEKVNDRYLLEVEDSIEVYRAISLEVEYEVECSAYISVEYITSVQGEYLSFLKDIDTSYLEKKIERVWPELLLEAKLDEIQKDAMKRW